MPQKRAARRVSPYAVSPKAVAPPKKAKPAAKSVQKPARGRDQLTATAEAVGTNLGQLVNQLEATRKAVGKVRGAKPKPVTIQIGGVRTGRQRGRSMSSDDVQRTHAEWPARMNEDRLAHKGIGKKATHGKVAVNKPLTEKV